MAQVPATDVEYTGNGSQTQFTVPFEFISRAYVFVTVGGVNTPFTWINDALIEITPAPANPSLVRIYRSTPAFEVFHAFDRGIPFLPRYVDENNTQLLDAVQEAVNDTVGTAANAEALAEEALETANRAEEKVDNATILSAEQLRLDLANTADPAKGAALVGYDAAVDYPVGSVGHVVRVGAYVTPEMFGGVADAAINDNTGAVIGTDNTAAVASALATGRPVVLARGGYKLSELTIPSGATLLTAGNSWITGPLNKSAIKVGSMNGAAVTSIHVDVVSRHPRIFNDAGVASSKGYAGGALTSGNTLTCAISCENVKNSRIRLRQEHGYIGFKSVHAFDGGATPAAPPAGAENNGLYLDIIATGECWMAAAVNVKNITGGRLAFLGNTDNDGIKSAIGFGKGASGQIDSVLAVGGFNGLVIEHECDGIQIGIVQLQKQRSKNLAISKGDQSTGPKNIQLGSVQILNGTSGTEIAGTAVDIFDAKARIGSLYIENATTYGVRLTTNAELDVDKIRGKNCGTLVFNNACTLRAGRVIGGDMATLVATGGAALTDISELVSTGNLTSHLLNGGANGVHHIRQARGQSGGGIQVGTGSAGSSFGILDLSATSSGFNSSTTFASLVLNRIITQNGIIEDYIAPGIKRLSGSGSPEGVVVANVGSEYTRLDPTSQSTVKYVKTSAPGASTGWTAMTLP